MPKIYKKYTPKIYFQNIFDGEKYIKNMMKNTLKIYFCCPVLEKKKKNLSIFHHIFHHIFFIFSKIQQKYRSNAI